MSPRSQCYRLLGRRRPVEACEVVADLLQEAVELEVRGDADGVGKAERIGRTVAFDRNAGQPEKHCPIMATRIEPRGEFIERSAGEDISDARRQRMVERGAQ